MLVVGLAAGVPSLLATGSPAPLVATVAAAGGGWLLLGTVTWLLGTRLFHSRAHWGGVLRTLGYASLPLVVLGVGVNPILGVVAMAIAIPLALFAAFHALTAALQVDGASTAITTAALPLIAGIFWILMTTATAQPEPDLSGACTGMVDGSGSCLPLEQLPPALQTRVALGTPLPR